jgi:hypothetical protein
MEAEKKALVRHFRVIATERTECVREADPDDKWDQGEDRIHVNFHCAMVCPDDTVGGMDAHFVCSEESDLRAPACGYSPVVMTHCIGSAWDYDEAEVALVVSRYATGSTFGRTSGHWEVEGAFSDMGEAKLWASANKETLEKKHNDYFGGLEDVEVFWLPFNNLWVARFPTAPAGTDIKDEILRGLMLPIDLIDGGSSSSAAEALLRRASKDKWEWLK